MLSKMGIISLIVALTLIGTSVYPMYLIIRESRIDSSIQSRYDVEQIINIRNESSPGEIMSPTHELASAIEWEGSTIEVMTEDTGVFAPKTHFDRESTNHIMKINIRINGVDISYPSEAWLSPDINSDSDYLSWLNIVEIKDNKINQEKLAIIQRISGKAEIGKNLEEFTESQKWRIIYVSKDKKVSEETFSYPERGDHLLGVKLVLYSSQSDLMGYNSEVLSYLPNLIFPLVYPILTCFLGILLLIITGVRILIVNKKKVDKIQ